MCYICTCNNNNLNSRCSSAKMQEEVGELSEVEGALEWTQEPPFEVQ